MNLAKNDITGDKLMSKKNTDKFRDNYDRIFGKGSWQDEVDGKAKEMADQMDDDLVKAMTGGK